MVASGHRVMRGQNINNKNKFKYYSTRYTLWFFKGNRTGSTHVGAGSQGEVVSLADDVDAMGEASLAAHRLLERRRTGAPAVHLCA